MNLQQTSIKNHFENTTKKSSKINKNEVNKLLIKSFPTKVFWKIMRSVRIKQMLISYVIKKNF